MELESLRAVAPGIGVKELWGRELSPEVKEAFEKAQEVLGGGKEKCLKVLTAA